MKASPKTLFLIMDNHWADSRGGAELQARYLEAAAGDRGWRTVYFHIAPGEQVDQEP